MFLGAEAVTVSVVAGAENVVIGIVTVTEIGIGKGADLAPGAIVQLSLRDAEADPRNEKDEV